MTTKSILHFSHANGFPGGSYQVLFNALSERYDVRWTDRIGHHPEFPVTNNWPLLEREMTKYFEQSYSEPVIAVGHSLGGILSMRLAVKRPDLVKAVVILDVPALSPIEASGLKLIKLLGMMDRFTPAARTDGRRSIWSNEEEAIEYFKAKRLMKQFDPRCLEHYVRYGTQPFDEGLRLHFDPSVEMKIYRTIPDDCVLRKPLPVPAVAIGGKESTILKPKQAARMRKKLGMKVHWLPGTHMFPLEYPEETAQTIINSLSELSL